MSEIKSIKEKLIEKKIDNLISGEENAELNMLMKMAYLGNYDDTIIENIKKKRQEDLALLLKEFELTDIQETLNCKTELIIKSNDNVDGENRIQGSDNQGQQDNTFKHTDHICYST
jgi:hypothetical protein